MTQQIIDVGANANDGTGEPLRNAFTAVNDNFTQVWEAGPVGTNVKIHGNVVTTTVTNQNLVLAANGVGNIQSNSSIVPGTPGVYDLGATNSPFQYVYGGYFVGNGALLTGITTSGNTTKIANGTSYANVATANGNVTIGADGNIWTFDTTGNLNIPGGSKLSPSGVNIDLIAGNGGWAELQSYNANSYMWVDDGGAYIGTNWTGNSHQWTFGAEGNLSAPGSISAVGNISGNYILGNGSQLTGISTNSSSIQNGNSNVQVYANSNIAISSNGVSNVMVVTSQDVTITGNLTVTGNATLSGNILGDRLQNGNTSIDIQTANGNANISVSGESNVAVFTPTGLSVTGNVSANVFSGSGTGLTSVLADRGSDTNNWDTLTQMGVYLVNRSSWSGTSGTPLDSQVFVGLLEVQTTQSQTTTQIFYPGQVEVSDVKMQWNRALWSGSWTPWVKMTNDGQQISGGVF